MRGAGWIKGLREAEAQELRREITQLELDLIEAANSKGKGKLHDIAHTLRWQKARLERLEECLAAMPVGKAISAGELKNDRSATSLSPHRQEWAG